MKLPHAAFHRKIGSFAGHYVSPDGRVLTKDEWERQSANWLPSVEDHEFVSSLMGRVIEPGKFASWIAPPARGINNLPIEFDYVRFD
jgi:benzoyl-CoA 2,3-epoxidase subunit B